MGTSLVGEVWIFDGLGIAVSGLVFGLWAFDSLCFGEFASEWKLKEPFVFLDGHTVLCCLTSLDSKPCSVGRAWRLRETLSSMFDIVTSSKVDSHAVASLICWHFRRVRATGI